MNLERIPPRPVAEGAPDPETIFMQWVWDVCARKFIDTPTVRFNADRNSIRAHAKAAGGGSNSFPFALYQGSTWLKWKVRKGYFIYTPSGDMVIPSNVDTEITIPTGILKNWFYVNLGTSAIATATTKPDWSATIIPIGYVDTDTHEDDERAVATQFCTTNIFSPCT